jgi:hypothetical protein
MINAMQVTRRNIVSGHRAVHRCWTLVVLSVVSTACAESAWPEHTRDDTNEAVLRWVIVDSLTETDADTAATPAAYCVVSGSGDFAGVDLQDPALLQ